MKWWLLLGIIILFSCNSRNEQYKKTELSLIYSLNMPQVKTYFQIEVNAHDSIYFFEQMEYWDVWKSNVNPEICKCSFRLKPDEISRLKKLILQANVFSLKDYYGKFTRTDVDSDSPVQIFSFTLNNQTKHIALKDVGKGEPSAAFIDFFNYLLQLQKHYYQKKV